MILLNIVILWELSHVLMISVIAILALLTKTLSIESTWGMASLHMY